MSEFHSGEFLTPWDGGSPAGQPAARGQAGLRDQALLLGGLCPLGAGVRMEPGCGLPAGHATPRAGSWPTVGREVRVPGAVGAEPGESAQPLASAQGMLSSELTAPARGAAAPLRPCPHRRPSPCRGYNTLARVDGNFQARGTEEGDPRARCLVGSADPLPVCRGRELAPRVVSWPCRHLVCVLQGPGLSTTTSQDRC